MRAASTPVGVQRMVTSLKACPLEHHASLRQPMSKHRYWMQELLGHCMDQSRRNDSAIAALETHLRQYGYAGEFRHSGGALPAPDRSSRPAGQADSYRNSAGPTEGRIGHERSLQLSGSSPSPLASSPPRRRINARDSPALLPLDNVLPERDGATHLRAMGGKGGVHIFQSAPTTYLT